jgi:hypothetical protein
MILCMNHSLNSTLETFQTWPKLPLIAPGDYKMRKKWLLIAELSKYLQPLGGAIKY